MPRYAIGYRTNHGEGPAVCEIFENWPTAFKRFTEMTDLSKTVFEIVEGPNVSNTSEV